MDFYKDYSVANTPLVAQGLQSTGLGTNGNFGPVEVVPNSADGGYADIAAGPKGELMVGFQNNSRSSGLAEILISVNTNEIQTNGLGTNDFPAPVIAATNAIGGFTYISAAPRASASIPRILWVGIVILSVRISTERTLLIRASAPMAEIW